MSSTRRRSVFRGSAPALFVKLVALAVVSAALTLTGPGPSLHSSLHGGLSATPIRPPHRHRRPRSSRS